MSKTDKLPAMLKTPTGWVMLTLVLGFFYMQWPTHVRQVPEPDYVWQTLDSGLMIRWEGKPIQQSADHPQVWGMSRKGMSFLVQTDTLNKPFSELVNEVAEQDRKEVGGAVQEPMQMGDDWATYAFFDAENRIQRHRWFLKDGQWIKVSILYSPSMDSRVARATGFMANLHFQ